MGWGNIGLSWTRYAKARATSHCGRCHLDYPGQDDQCPHCGHLDDEQLQRFLVELDAKKKKSTRLFMLFITALLLYAIIVLVVLPRFL